MGFIEKVTSEKYLKEIIEPVMPVSGGRALQAEGAASAMALRPVEFEELQGSQGWAAMCCWRGGRGGGGGGREEQ